MPIPEWPVGPTFFAEQLGMRPYLPTTPPPLFPYQDWGRTYPTTVWQEAGAVHSEAGVSPPGWRPTVERMRRHPEISNAYALAWWMRGQGYHPHYRHQLREAAQASDAGWYAELIRDRHTPNVAKPYLERNEPPPEPGGTEYFADVRPVFRYGPIQEQAYIDWWYAHFTSDTPGPRYTLPTTPTGAPDEPTTTITTVGEPVTTTTTTTTARRAPWGWVVGGSAVLLLVGGGVAYYLTRPKRRRDGGRRRRSRR